MKNRGTEVSNQGVKRKKLSLAAGILLGMLLGIFGGAALNLAGQAGFAAKYVKPFGAIYINLLKVMVVLVVLLSIVCGVVAANGAAIVGSLALVILVAFIAYAFHILAVYSLSVKTLARISSVKFFRGMAPAMLCGFTTSSSNATLPMNMRCCKELEAENEITSFVLPLGATINMDGTAIYMGVTSVFIASCYGVSLSLGQMAAIVLTATVASIGTADVSGAGMIMLAMVLESVNLPVAGIALIAGVDKLFDMGRTTLNITGDATCTLWISCLEREKKKA